MKSGIRALCELVVCLLPGLICGLQAQTPATAVLSGVVTDASGSSVPGAVVTVRGPGGTQRMTTNESGQYSLPGLRLGKYTIRVLSTGFGPFEASSYDVVSNTTLDVRLTIATEAQVVTVREELNQVTVDSTSNASAIVLGEKELET